MNERIKLYRLSSREVKMDALVPIGEFDDLDLAEDKIREICSDVQNYEKHSLVAPILINYPGLSIACIQAKILTKTNEFMLIDFGIRLERI